jgi:hypothetical protein
LCFLQGKYAELPSQQATLDLITNDVGAFALNNPTAAAYTFKSNANTECVDSLTSKFYAGLFITFGGRSVVFVFTVDCHCFSCTTHLHTALPHI